MGLSLLLRGTLLEKLEWTFNLYDINGDGIITADELYLIVSSVYDIIGNFTEPRVDENSIRDHVDTVFKVLHAAYWRHLHHHHHQHHHHHHHRYHHSYL